MAARPGRHDPARRPVRRRLDRRRGGRGLGRARPRRHVLLDREVRPLHGRRARVGGRAARARPAGRPLGARGHADHLAPPADPDERLARRAVRPALVGGPAGAPAPGRAARAPGRALRLQRHPHEPAVALPHPAVRAGARGRPARAGHGPHRRRRRVELARPARHAHRGRARRRHGREPLGRRAVGVGATARAARAAAPARRRGTPRTGVARPAARADARAARVRAHVVAAATARSTRPGPASSSSGATRRATSWPSCAGRAIPSPWWTPCDRRAAHGRDDVAGDRRGRAGGRRRAVVGGLDGAARTASAGERRPPAPGRAVAADRRAGARRHPAAPAVRQPQPPALGRRPGLPGDDVAARLDAHHRRARRRRRAGAHLRPHRDRQLARGEREPPLRGRRARP